MWKQADDLRLMRATVKEMGRKLLSDTIKLRQLGNARATILALPTPCGTWILAYSRGKLVVAGYGITAEPPASRSYDFHLLR